MIAPPSAKSLIQNEIGLRPYRQLPHETAEPRAGNRSIGYARTRPEASALSATGADAVI
jgi:hypothetical protein